MTSPDPNVISPRALHYLRLKQADGVGPIIVRRLVEHFGDIENVLAASPEQLAEVDGVGLHRARAIAGARSDNGVEEEIARAADQGVRIVCPEDRDYPAQLEHVPDPPLCLYLRGRLEPGDAVAIAIVGSRRCTHYGCEQARRFAAALAGAGFTIVSGLARGIDGHAHQGALAAGGRTLAVLGNGLTRIYPPEHAALAGQVEAAGALLSELPLDAAPEAKNFPGRNRIITGLCLGVIVIEAARRSGALITARLASEYNREVFALPGRVDSETSAGTNALIRDGHAKLITCLEDVLDELGDVGHLMRPDLPNSSEPAAASGGGPAPFTPGRLTNDERVVLGAVGIEPIHQDHICRTCDLAAGAVAAALTGLQLKGAIRPLAGNLFVRRSNGP
ncbi:MAG: DNA-protecting protein DprA [bacterium]|nr:DNA-protecting protein DprA [bacterium]